MSVEFFNKMKIHITVNVEFSKKIIIHITVSVEFSKKIIIHITVSVEFSKKIIIHITVSVEFSNAVIHITVSVEFSNAEPCQNSRTFKYFVLNILFFKYFQGLNYFFVTHLSLQSLVSVGQLYTPLFGFHKLSFSLMKPAT